MVIFKSVFNCCFRLAFYEPIRLHRPSTSADSSDHTRRLHPCLSLPLAPHCILALVPPFRPGSVSAKDEQSGLSLRPLSRHNVTGRNTPAFVRTTQTRPAVVCASSLSARLGLAELTTGSIRSRSHTPSQLPIPPPASADPKSISDGLFHHSSRLI